MARKQAGAVKGAVRKRVEAAEVAVVGAVRRKATVVTERR